MKRSLISKWLLLPFLVVSMTFTSCLDLSITNSNLSSEQVNEFQIVKAGLYNTTMVEYHEYICSDDINHLIVSGPIDNGHVAVIITDDEGNVIFNKKLSGFTEFDEFIEGVSGIWTIKLDYVDARGSIDLRLTNQ